MENEKHPDLKTLRVVEAAQEVFLRYGFRRVTMQDIANQAGISRPALYLVYPNKEEVFKATIQNIMAVNIASIRASLPEHRGAEAQLRYAFEVWSVQTFQLMLHSPDARDLVHCAQGFAKETVAAIDQSFELLITEILTGHLAGHKPVLTPKRIAHLLTASIHGYKDAVSTVDELRQMIHDLIVLTLEALHLQHTTKATQPIAKTQAKNQS